MFLGIKRKGNYMDKTKFHLGQILTYDGKKAVIDALTQSHIALRIGGDYIVEDWENLPLLLSGGYGA